MLWDQLHDKAKPVHLALRRNTLIGLLTGALPDAVRAEYKQEIEDISIRLGGLNVDFEFLNDEL